MPVKRRVPKGRSRYPDAIVRLIEGRPIECTEENQTDLVSFQYFGDFPELSDELRRRAAEITAKWRAEK